MIDAKYDDPKAACFGHVRGTDLNADVGRLQICVGPDSSSRVCPAYLWMIQSTSMYCKIYLFWPYAAKVLSRNLQKAASVGLRSFVVKMSVICLDFLRSYAAEGHKVICSIIFVALPIFTAWLFSKH